MLFVVLFEQIFGITAIKKDINILHSFIDSECVHNSIFYVVRWVVQRIDSQHCCVL